MLLKNIIIILIILAILFLSQQTYLKGPAGEISQKIKKWGTDIWQKIADFWNKHILHRVSQEIEKRQNIIKQEIKDETKQAAQNTWQKVKNYVAGFFTEKRKSLENK